MKKGLHIGPVSINSGDIYLMEAAERVISNDDMHWTRRDARVIVTDDDIIKINSTYDFILLGPGGILMLDAINGKGMANMNKIQFNSMMNISGYQWLINKTLLESIKIPIIVFSIGWNYFRTLFPTKEPFSSSLKALIDKSAYFSMRHTGDIKDLLNFIEYDNDKPNLCYCPTIISSGDYPEARNHDNIVGFQIANDRWEARYVNAPKMFNSIYVTMLRIEEMGYKIHVIDQCLDSMFIEWLHKNNKWKNSFTKVILKSKSYEDQQQYYKSLDSIFATRGHGQMIPMGLGVSVVSIISHDKLKYFLEDILIPETGIEANEITVDRLIEKFNISKNTDFKRAIDKIKLNILNEVKDIRKIIMDTSNGK